MLRCLQSIALAAQVVWAWSPESWEPKDYYNNNDWNTVYKVTVPHIAQRTATSSTPGPMDFLTKLTHDADPVAGSDRKLVRPTAVPLSPNGDQPFWQQYQDALNIKESTTGTADTIYQTVQVTFGALSDCLSCAVKSTSTAHIQSQTPTAAPLHAPSVHDSRVSSLGHESLAKGTSCASLSTASGVASPDTTHALPATSSSLSSYGPPTAGEYLNCSLPTSPLANHLQVGDSVLGSLCQPHFPHWLGDSQGKPYTSAPWGERTPRTADATVDSDIPRTGVTRRYEFTISRGHVWADGVKRDAMLVNNQFPGPAIEANWGDEIEVIVHNNISAPMEGTAMHYHGFLQRGSNWMDGVPSVSQCPIAPGASFTYRFTAQLYGTSFYHAHYSAQYTAGVAGPIIIHGPSQLPYDIDIGPVMLTDWFHIPYFSIVKDVVGTDMTKLPPKSDSLLINGRGRFDCAEPSYSSSSDWVGSNIASNQTWECVDGAELSKFRFQSGKIHRLRLINHGADGVQKFSIDGHKMTVIATDYVPTVPYTTETVTLGVAQRTDVLVQALDTPGATYWMRARTPGGSSMGGSAHAEVLAAIYYDGADPSLIPASQGVKQDAGCENEPLEITQPEYVIAPSGDAYQQNLVLGLERNSSGNFEWLINGQTFRANFNSPSLYLAADGNTTYPDPEWNMFNFGQNKSIILNVTNATPYTHPFHLHGHNFFVLNIGSAGTTWDGSIVNPGNPMRRDTVIIPPLGWAAFSFESDNPGIWPFHCHVAWHLSGGLAMNIMTRPNDIPKIPRGMEESTCIAWNAYTDRNTVDQIDAGS